MKNNIYSLMILCIWSLIGCERAIIPPRDSLIIGNGAEPQSIDPHKCTGVPGIRIIGALFEGLVTRCQERGGICPGIAKSWNTSIDKKKYTFHLRKSLWSDGTPVTSKDFVNSWRRLLNPETGAEYASLLNIVIQGEEIINGMVPPASLAVFAPNDSTFIVNLKAPIPYFLHLCAFEPLFPVPGEIISKYKEKWTSPAHLVSNGPFSLSHWQPNKNMVLKKNPLYWDVKKVKLDKVELLPIEHEETAYKMFLNGEVDWLFTIPLGKVDIAKKMREYHNTPLYGVYYYALNVTHPKLQSPDLRKALAFSIDRKKLVKYVTKGGEIPATGFVPVSADIPYAGFNRNLYNQDSALFYLHRAGFSKQFPPPKLSILYNTTEGHKKIATAVSQMWKEQLGIEIELLNYEWKVFLQSTKNLKHNIARASWIADYPDPYSFLELAISDNGNNRTGYNNPVYDACMEKSRTMSDQYQRMKQLLLCETLLMEDMPVIPVYFYASNELRSTSIKNAIPNTMGLYAWKHLSFGTDK
ncbi:MAG: peptide ABC transporter substrate-binding protein [Fibrobacteria bacterium]|nr:peptide ABC transporter substrate-binding protein [Fibrobacteria bacterium]